MAEEFSDNRSIGTTVSMPVWLYVQLLQRARAENISLSEVVRRALHKEFETDTEQKGLGEK